MLPEVGQFALVLALCLALVQAVLPLAGAARGDPAWIAAARPAARAQLLFLSLAYACLTFAFVSHDFSVDYVARNSNTALPLLYRISGVWGSHEGSLLLWALVLALWTGAVTAFSTGVPERVLARVLGVMGLVSVGFIAFLLFTSNPFRRRFPVPPEGHDLNPLLQDPGLALHPPMLYLGYVGFAVAFAFAIAALLEGRLDAAWARWVRPWTGIAWAFLTLGIALGSWWAYYELGWGGWWFWDPVENASFMPWLSGTALIHSLAVTEQRGGYKAWTVLLAVFTFALSLLGTFLVRSGVLTSVHAFASDPARGVFVLAFLGVVVGASLLLYAWRAPALRSHGRFELFSRETALLLNNVFLVVAAASILLGTLYPLVLDALALGKISVGPPYFNRVFVPLTVPLALLVGVGAMLRWRQDSPLRLLRALRTALIASLVLGAAFAAVAMPWFAWSAAAGVALALWVLFSNLRGLYARVAGRPRPWAALAAVPRAYYGMSVAHIGIALFIAGVTLTSVYSEERDLRLAPGESQELGGYRFRLDGVRRVRGANFIADEGSITVTRGDRVVTVLAPQKRRYLTQPNPMTEAAIDAGFTRDLFVALGEPLGDDGSWSLRLYHKPFLRWIWFGAVLMAAGGMLAAGDRRYRTARRRIRATASLPAAAAAAGVAS